MRQDSLEVALPTPPDRAVIEAALAAVRGSDAAGLAVVLETEGSTYVGAGAMALFGAAAGQAGWLSGGCLEPEIAQAAQRCADAGRIGWLDIDTRDDEDLLYGSALGCRGRLRIALLPLRALPGIERAFDAWRAGGIALRMALDRDGAIAFAFGDEQLHWRIGAAACDWAEGARSWAVAWPAPPELLLFGGGPETPPLLALLRGLGWRATLVERRERWRGLAALADRHVDATPAAALSPPPRADAALVMHHNFELDREALSALAGTAIPYIGLLGPVRRREDLFKLLSETERAALAPRLRSPVGLDLGGRGAQAIALSVAAQLQAWRYGIKG